MTETTTQNVAPKGNSIAHNTIFLYARMLLSMFIGLYSSRIVLKQLGVEDYGLYSLVGGVVYMLNFLQAAMSGATSRFITYELGKGDAERVRNTFNTALIIHIIIGIIIVLFAETVGLWFLFNKLVIPLGRESAAFWVFQISSIMLLLGIAQTPFTACMIAREKMDIFAYIDILGVALKLGVLFLLTYSPFDKLIYYSVLLALTGVITLALSLRVCIKNFPETQFRFVWKKEYYKPMLTFSGWDLYGNACVSARTQGATYLINMFFGVAYNAANGVASTVQGLLEGFSYNIIQAFRPAIIKSYAADDIKRMQTLVGNALKFMLLMFGLLAIPFIVGMHQIMTLWLGTIPPMADLFCQILIVYSTFRLINNIVGNCIHATGDIRKISFISGTVFLLSLIAIYVAYKTGMPVETTYYIFVITTMLVICVNIIIIHQQIPKFGIWSIFWNILHPIAIVIIAGIIPYFLYQWIGENLMSLLVVLITNTMLVLVLGYISMTAEQKVIFRKAVRKISGKVTSKFKKA